jgi:hypothetical protein
MSKQEQIRIHIGSGPMDTRIFIGAHEITQYVNHLSVHVDVRESLPTVVLGFIPLDLCVDGDARMIIETLQKPLEDAEPKPETRISPCRCDYSNPT